VVQETEEDIRQHHTHKETTHMAATHILVVDDDRLWTEVVEYKLVSSGYQVAVAHSGEEALSKVRSVEPDLIVLDVMMPNMSGYDVLRHLRHQSTTSKIPVIMVTARGRMADKVTGFEAGADDYLIKPVDLMELELRIRALLARSAGWTEKKVRREKAEIVTVFSLKGGVGVSSIAVNLAVALAQMCEVEVPLVDLALESGHDALMLGLKARQSLAELSTTSLDQLDADLLMDYLLKHESGVRLLPAPLRLEQAELVAPMAVDHILTLASRLFAYVVLDLPSTFNEVTLTALDLSTMILVVLDPSLAALKATASTLDVFASLGYPDDRIMLALNSTFRNGALSKDSIEAALKCRIPFVIPYDDRLFIEGIQRGVPAVLSRPKAASARALFRLAGAVSRNAVRRQSRSDRQIEIRESRQANQPMPSLLQVPTNGKVPQMAA
jgi:pilus assembly protein CpaE